MLVKRIFILPLCLSVAGHLALLFMTGLAGMRLQDSRQDVLTVELKKAAEISGARKKEEKKRSALPRSRGPEIAGVISGGRPDAEMVDLGDTHSQYTPYLKQLRMQIEKIWVYPEEAYANKEEGIAVVRFSITKNGKIEDVDIMASSGFPRLDESTVQVIKAAAPYEPLPAIFHIARLNIVAAFRYRIAP